MGCGASKQEMHQMKKYQESILEQQEAMSRKQQALLEEISSLRTLLNEQKSESETMRRTHSATTDDDFVPKRKQMRRSVSFSNKNTRNEYEGVPGEFHEEPDLTGQRSAGNGMKKPTFVGVEEEDGGRVTRKNTGYNFQYQSEDLDEGDEEEEEEGGGDPEKKRVVTFNEEDADGGRRVERKATGYNFSYVPEDDDERKPEFVGEQVEEGPQRVRRKKTGGPGNFQMLKQMAQEAEDDEDEAETSKVSASEEGDRRMSTSSGVPGAMASTASVGTPESVLINDDIPPPKGFVTT
eukprot:Sspe_Gene.93387::Locus_66040_Transcript_1_1_Confidence_1.000_Length_1177::g.93387::m.93387